MADPSNPGQETARQPLELALARDVTAPAAARGAIGDLCAELGLERSVCQAVTLLVSELVSNAVLHSSAPPGEPIVLTAAVHARLLRVSVTDAGEGFTPGERDPGRPDGGYGLDLLGKVATRWNIEASPSTCVWFELSLGS